MEEKNRNNLYGTWEKKIYDWKLVVQNLPPGEKIVQEVFKTETAIIKLYLFTAYVLSVFHLSKAQVQSVL